MVSQRDDAGEVNVYDELSEGVSEVVHHQNDPFSDSWHYATDLGSYSDDDDDYDSFDDDDDDDDDDFYPDDDDDDDLDSDDDDDDY